MSLGTNIVIDTIDILKVFINQKNFLNNPKDNKIWPFSFQKFTCQKRQI